MVAAVQFVTGALFETQVLPESAEVYKGLPSEIAPPLAISNFSPSAEQAINCTVLVMRYHDIPELVEAYNPPALTNKTLPSADTAATFAFGKPEPMCSQDDPEFVET